MKRRRLPFSMKFTEHTSAHGCVDKGVGGRPRIRSYLFYCVGQHTWRGDEVMDHSQALLRRQYPQVGGLYAVTSLTQLTSFSSTAQGFVQILNVSCNHWVTVSNIGCEEGTLNVFDSLGINNKHEFCSQVISLLQYSGKTVWIGWPHVQQQGWSDCGLFTIANSLRLCMGGDPGKLCYD
ncbi:UNVERIFIED_CONTAM: hypothetical protein FKN15_024370 [Acipenser sinensis]